MVLVGSCIFTSNPFPAIFFDAKEDKNVRLSQRDERGLVRHTIGKRSHYSVDEQPGANPLGIFVPESSTGNTNHNFSSTQNWPKLIRRYIMALDTLECLCNSMMGENNN